MLFPWRTFRKIPEADRLIRDGRDGPRETRITRALPR